MSELYKLPDGWEWKKLGELAKFQSGGTPSRSNKTYWENGDIPWVKISDITDNMYVSKTEEFITKSGLDNSSAKLFSKGTILYTIFATIGKIGILDIEATTNQAISGIQPNENIDLIYMYYGLKFITNEIQKISVGVAQNNINLTKLKEQWFPLPPLEEQKRIVVNLDNLFAKIDKAIALHQKNCEEADIFMASVLNDIFEELEEKYDRLFLNDVSTFQNGFAFKSNEFNTIGNGFQVIRIGNVLDIKKNQVFIDKRQEFEKYLLKENDIVISMTGTRNKMDYLFVRVITENNSYLNQRVGRISSKDNSNYLYLYYFLQSNNFRDKIFEFETGTVNQGNISSKDILNIKIPLPPLETQQKVVSYLDEVSNKMEKIKQIQKEKMQSLKELKASILDKAFKGEL